MKTQNTNKTNLIPTAKNLERVNLSPLLAGNIEANIKVNRPEEHESIFTTPASVFDKAS